MNNQPPYEDPGLKHSILCQLVLDSITSREQLTDKELFQTSCFLESTAFFKMIVPLIILFDSSAGNVEKHQDYITETAHYFDSNAYPVFSLTYDSKDIQFLSEKEFEEYMLKAISYKAGLLRIAKQEIQVMKERIASNKSSQYNNSK